MRWWRGAELSEPEPLPPALPFVAYDPPCSLRELALSMLDALGVQAMVTAESPHMTGVQAAARNSLGDALLADGGDGLSRVRSPAQRPRPDSAYAARSFAGRPSPRRAGLGERS